MGWQGARVPSKARKTWIVSCHLTTEGGQPLCAGADRGVKREVQKSQHWQAKPHNLTPPASPCTLPARSHICPITLPFLGFLPGLHSPMPRRSLSTYLNKTQLKVCLFQEATIDFPSKKQTQTKSSLPSDSVLINYSLAPLIASLCQVSLGHKLASLSRLYTL